MSIQKTKLAELNSNLSTIYSDNAPRTPLSMDALSSKANLGFKKFARKKDTSIDAIKKCLQQKNVPKKINHKKQEKQYLNKTLDAIQESQISKIIKSNSFIKFFNTSGLNPKIGPFQLDKLNSRICQQIRCQKKKQRNSFSMNNFEGKKTEQKKKPLTIQQFDEFSTPRNSRKEIPKKKNSKIPNYEILYTQRQKNQKLPNPQMKQIKVLQNEIIILEDENTRLRNQINVLVHEKQEYTAKKNQFERYIKDLQNEVNNKKKAEIDFLEYIISNFHQIYLQIIKILQDNRLENNINSSIGSHEEDIFSSTIKNNKITIENFSKLFMEPAKQFINEKIKDYSQLFEHSKVELNKLQIRQNVMLRSSFQLQNTKVQNRMLNQKLSAEKSRSLKFKQMYEKLKNSQEQGKFMNKKKFNLSQNFLQTHQKNYKGNQETSFILSDLSDDQQPKLNNNKRMIKQM